MARGKTLDRNTHAGNPHVAFSHCYGVTGRFDEEEVALEKQKRGFLLHKKLKMVIVTIAAILLNAATAGTHTWKASGAVNDWDWTNAGNFDGGAPTADGTAVVVIPESTTVRLLGTDADSLARFATLAGISFSGKWDKPNETSRLVIDTDSDLSVSVPMNISSFLNGEVVKRGSGMLSLVGSGADVTTKFYTSFKIEEGTLELPASSANCNFTSFTISSNATLRTVTGGGRTYCFGIFGDGTVTNTDSHGGREFHINPHANGRVPPSVFGGVLAHGIRYCSSANVTLTGTNSTAGAASGVPFTVYGSSAGVCGTNGVKTIGMLNAPSSTGEGHLCLSDYGGAIRYEGEGETTDKDLKFQKPHQGFCTFDAGAVGGITFTGAWDINYSAAAGNHGMGMLVITGSNTVPCVMNGAIPQAVDSNSKTCSLHIVKSGTGTWRFSDSLNRHGATAMTIEEGTLQFDSLDLKGDLCAVGTAADTHEAYYGRYDGNKVTPYAFFAGSPGKDATLELTGTRGAYSIGRLMGLNGDIRLKNDTASAFRFAGVEPITDGGKTLRLAGSGTGENEIAGIKDRAEAKISVEKEGSGTWTLSGSNSFTGKLVVNGGRLNIRSRAGDYTWFRLTIRSTVYNNTGGYPEWLPPLSADPQYTGFFQMNEWFLLDAGRRRQNIGFSACDALPSIQPGQIAYFGRFGVTGYGSNATIQQANANPALLCDATSAADGIQVHRTGISAPKPDDPSTWLPFVLRLTNGTPRIAAYDFVCNQGTNSINNSSKTYPGSRIGALVGSYLIEGSLDGLAWDLIAENANTTDPTGAMRVQKNANCVMSAGRSYSAERTGGDYVWDISPEVTCYSTVSGSALDTVTAVTLSGIVTLVRPLQ